MKRKILIAALFMTLTGCATFESTMTFSPDGTRTYTVKESGALGLNRTGNFRTEDEWLDGDNALHEMSVSRNIEENTDNQLQMMLLIRDLAIQAGKAGAGVP